MLKLEELGLWHGFNVKTLAHYHPNDVMICTVVGRLEVIIAPSWDRLFVYAGKDGAPENYSPVDFKSPDMRNYPDFRFATKYKMKLNPGDCLYLPAYWWQQVEIGKQETIAIMHYY